jgi:hypothetical protein
MQNPSWKATSFLSCMKILSLKLVFFARPLNTLEILSIFVSCGTKISSDVRKIEFPCYFFRSYAKGHRFQTQNTTIPISIGTDVNE